MKADLSHNGLTLQVQDCLIVYCNLSYIKLGSTTIDQERTMKASEVAGVKKRKRTMPRSSGFSSSSAPLKYHMVYIAPMEQPYRPPQFQGNRQQY
jgi:hypothetical protein